MKLIAFYLPQYHPIPENSKWWGEGFTEWTNVKRAKPFYHGHHQPRRPSVLGYYDLRSAQVREAQADLARRYGIYGFCYYYYWFNGKKLLDFPLSQTVQTKKPDYPFCICFSNENWTRRWDGQDEEVLIRQEHSLESDKRFIQDVIPLFSDPRYISIRGKPLLILYRLDLLQNPKETAVMWRSEARKAGLNDLFLVYCQTFEIERSTRFDDTGFDAVIEFPPHKILLKRKTFRDMSRDFQGSTYDYRDIARSMVKASFPTYQLFKTVMLEWDNTARRMQRATIFRNFSLGVYEEWLREVIKLTAKRYPTEEQFVFINAWNEWGEGTYLEPDDTYGFGYLEATNRALRDALHDIERYKNTGRIKNFFTSFYL